jgi:radical SAM protein with 4Fe4S-binding SPASM domain
VNKNIQQIRGLKKTISDAEVFSIRDKGELRSLTLEVTKHCNYQCIYCYASENAAQLEGCDNLTIAEFKRIIAEGKELGVELINLTGGEALLHKDIFELIQYIYQQGLDILLFTNGMLIDDEIARQLFHYHCSLCLKLDSLEKSKYEYFTGFNGLENTKSLIETLLNLGYNKPGSPTLEINAIATKANAAEIPVIWRWARERNIKPTFTRFWPVGEAAKNLDLLLQPDELKKLYEEVAHIDNEFGIPWDVKFPGCSGVGCKNFYLDCAISSEGYVRPCPCIQIYDYQIKGSTLNEIITQSDLFQKTRFIEKYIKGHCKNCEFLTRCYGCRSIAFGMTGDMFAPDPLCWHNPQRHKDQK